MKRSNGFTLIEVAIVVTIICIMAALLIPSLSGQRDEYLKRQSMVIDLFNDQEVKVESWMFYWVVDDIASAWCVNHSIPVDQRQAKTKELIDRFKYSVNNAKIKLLPLPTENNTIAAGNSQ